MLKKYLLFLLFGLVMSQMNYAKDQGPYIYSPIFAFFALGCSAYVYANSKDGMKEGSARRLALGALGASAIVFAFEDSIKDEKKLNFLNGAAFSIGCIGLYPILHEAYNFKSTNN